MQNTDQSVSHTSGPWHVEKSCGRYEIWPKDNGEPHTFVGIAQTEANARLIAAAPELLEALQFLLKEFHQHIPEDCECTFVKDAADQAQAAIAKAQGRDA